MLSNNSNNKSPVIFIFIFIFIIISITSSSISASTPGTAYLKKAKRLSFQLVACQKSGNHFVGRNTDSFSKPVYKSSTRSRGAQSGSPGQAFKKGRTGRLRRTLPQPQGIIRIILDTHKQGQNG